ncbi:MAG TPA: type II secretion system minor pseudopilin GspK [Geobacteraceae bacterium]|nr:type II secretion system minor pseudopilin GspK [Geobacteraceae bacterium]
MKKESGFALVITLIVAALLVAVAVEFIHDIYMERSLSRSYADAQQAALLADSGVFAGIKLLQANLADQEYSSLLDKWAQPIEIEDDKGKLRVEIIDESGKLNLNSIVFPNGTVNPAFFPMAQRLFSSLKLPVDLCDAVADWMDTDDEPRPGGAETSYYKTLPTPYMAKNAPLDTFDELRLVKGFDEKTLNTLSPFVTAYNDGSGAPFSPININTAPRQVLAAIDENMNDMLAGRILDYRKTTPFKSTNEVSNISGLETIGIGLQGKISVKGTVYRIFSQATVNGTTRIVEALARADGSQPAILYWREM